MSKVKFDIDMTPKQPAIDFNKCLVDLSEEIKQPQPLFSIGENMLFSRGNISCVSGSAKSRKTFCVGLFAAQFLECNDTFSVVIFDTEQSAYHAQRSAKRIHLSLKWDDTHNNDRLRVFRLRELSVEQRIDFVNGVIEKYKPDLIFLDGVRDLLHNFNDISESSNIVNMLMRLSSQTNSHICCVMHLNKGDNNLRGHACGELQNKAESVITVERIDDFTSEVTPKYCRNIDFEKFYFRVNRDGLPEYCEPALNQKNADKYRELFDEIFKANKTLSYSELTNKIMQIVNIKIDMAKKKIKAAVDLNVIAKNEIGYYYIVNNYENEQNNLPF